MLELLVALALVLVGLLVAQKAIKWFFAMLRPRRLSEPFRPKPFSEVEINRARQMPPPVEPEISIEYADGSVVIQHDIARLTRSPYNRNHFKAWSFTSDAERTFRHHRIRSAIELRTGRKISDLRRYVSEN